MECNASVREIGVSKRGAGNDVRVLRHLDAFVDERLHAVRSMTRET